MNRKSVLDSPLLRKGHAHQPGRTTQRREEHDLIEQAIDLWQQADSVDKPSASFCQSARSDYKRQRD